MAASRFCRPTVFFVVSSLGALLHPTSARACDFAGPTAHTIDPALQATDHVPPVWPSPPRAQGVQRGRGPQQNGCGGTASSCDDIGIITITTGATDDTTAPGRVGYRLSQASGALPAGLSLPPDAVEPNPDGSLTLVWSDGATDNQDSFSFTLDIVAIDAAGNESAPQVLVIEDGRRDGACALAGRPRPWGWAGLASLLVLGLVATLRRRAPRHVTHLGHELRIRRHLERARNVRLEPEGPPDAADHRVADPRLLRHLPRAPVRLSLRCRLQRLNDDGLDLLVRDRPRASDPRLIVQSVEAAFDETPAPFPDGLIRRPK